MQLLRDYHNIKIKQNSLKSIGWCEVANKLSSNVVSPHQNNIMNSFYERHEIVQFSTKAADKLFCGSFWCAWGIFEMLRNAQNSIII